MGSAWWEHLQRTVLSLHPLACRVSLMPGAGPGCLPETAFVSALLASSTLQPSQGVSSVGLLMWMGFLSSPSEYPTLSSVREEEIVTHCLQHLALRASDQKSSVSILAICFLSLDALFLPLCLPTHVTSPLSHSLSSSPSHPG